MIAWGWVSACQGPPPPYPTPTPPMPMVGVGEMIWGEVLNMADKEPGAVNFALISAI